MTPEHFWFQNEKRSLFQGRMAWGRFLDKSES